MAIVVSAAGLSGEMKMHLRNILQPLTLAFVFVAACSTDVTTTDDDSGTDASDNTDDAGATSDANDASSKETGAIDSGASCSPDTCAGCCFNGVCQPGNTVSACGGGGVSCAQCVTNQVCLTDQTCGVDPESTWLVQPDSAKISTTNNGNDWDLGGGAPDPFVQLWCPFNAASVTSQTPFVQDSFTPTWSTGGCLMKAKDLLSLGYSIEVWDADVSNDDVIAAKASIAVTEKHLLQGYMTMTNNSTLLSMKVLLLKQ